MKFQYYLPIDEDQTEQDSKFLPSIVFIIFSKKEEDQEHESLQSLYARRIPQIMRHKIKLLGRFSTHLIIPIGKDKLPHYFIEPDTEEIWDDQDLLSDLERFDYVISGSLSLDKGEMDVQLYSSIDDLIVYDRNFSGDIENFFDFANDFTGEALKFLDLSTPEKPDDTEKIIKNRPVENKEAFKHLLHAYEYDPSYNVNISSKAAYVSSLKKALKADPKSHDVADMLIASAESIYNKNNPDIAEHITDFVLSILPDNKKANILKGRIDINAGKMKEVLERLDSIAKKTPACRELPYLLAREFLEQGHIESVEQLFEKSIQIGYDDPLMYESYGYLLNHQNKKDKAIEIFSKAVEKYPYREHSMTHLAQLQTEEGNIEQANETYERALSLFPESSRLLTSRAIFYIRQNDTIKARKFIESALDNSPEDEYINLEGAKVFNYLKDEETAQRLAKTAIDLGPKTQIAEEARDLICRISGNITEEEQHENRLLFISAIRMMEKTGEEAAENLDSSIEMLDKVTQTEPLFWNAWFAKGIAYRRKGNIDEALKALENVDELFTDQASLHHEIARCLMAKEEFHEAFDHMLYAFRKRPEDPIIMANMGLIYMFLGKLQEAEILFLHIKRVAPDIVDIDPYLAELEKLKKRKKSTRSNGDTHE